MYLNISDGLPLIRQTQGISATYTDARCGRYLMQEDIRLDEAVGIVRNARRVWRSGECGATIPELNTWTLPSHEYKRNYPPSERYSFHEMRSDMNVPRQTKRGYMNKGSFVTWISKPRSSSTRPYFRAIVLTGVIIDSRIFDDASIEHLVYLIRISGPDDVCNNDRIWVKEHDLIKWRADECQHYNPSSPFERLKRKYVEMRKERQSAMDTINHAVARLTKFSATVKRQR
jgi:hypothetical protein